MSPRNRRRLNRRNRPVDLPVTRAEPALVRGVIVAVLGLLATLGVSWAADVSKETIGYLVGVGVVVVPLAQALWTRYGVVAAAKVVARLSTSTGTVVAGEAASAPTGRVLLTAPAAASGAEAVVVAPDPTLLRR